MTRNDKAFVALVRAINVGGRKVPMADLCRIVTALGFRNVCNYIQSGNLVFLGSAKAGPSEVEAAVEQAIERTFGFAADVVVRTKAAWATYAKGSPFPDAQADRPQHVLLGLSKQAPKGDAAPRLQAYAVSGERVAVIGDAVWIDFPEGMARTKITPAVLDRLVGSPVTGRNWRTVQKLDTMLHALV